jgi:hypothetical protein
MSSPQDDRANGQRSDLRQLSVEHPAIVRDLGRWRRARLLIDLNPDRFLVSQDCPEPFLGLDHRQGRVRVYQVLDKDPRP